MKTMRRWRCELVDLAGNVLCSEPHWTRWGAHRAAHRYGRHLFSGMVRTQVVRGHKRPYYGEGVIK